MGGMHSKLLKRKVDRQILDGAFTSRWLRRILQVEECDYDGDGGDDDGSGGAADDVDEEEEGESETFFEIHQNKWV